jgi:glycerol-3-phosphate acyltransferase PlsX
MTVRVALDAMGGDQAPAAPVAGAVDALRRFDDLEVLRVGDPTALEREVAKAGGSPGDRLRIRKSGAALGMDEEPVRGMKARPDNSARVAAEALAAGDVQGVVNLGSTGAAVAAAMLFCPRLPGVKRPGIAVPFPREEGATIVVDCGANLDANAAHLHQYALMASRYARAALGTKAPRIGILSVGEEEHKGNRLVRETWEAFRASPVPGFLGNVEGRDVFEGKVDVVVCDGFAGNVLLKGCEGIAELALRLVAKASAAAGGAPGAAAGGAGAAKGLRSKLDYAEYGGAPLLGIRGAYLIGHGRSDARAVSNALRAARSYLVEDLDAKIAEDLAATPTAGGA